jgi:hypothetical protein
MITNLEILDDETALAFGQKFDVPKVLEAMIAFLKTFTADIARAAPHIAPTIRFSGDGDRLDPLDDDGYARLRRETIGPGNDREVEAIGVRVDIGTFRLRLYVRGRDDLRRCGQTAPVLIDDGSWRDLDPTPVIEFQPRQGMLPLFDPKPLALLTDLMRIHAPAGASFVVDRCIPSLRFPHHAFGMGLGTLRISLITIPVEP